MIFVLELDEAYASIHYCGCDSNPIRPQKNITCDCGFHRERPLIIVFSSPMLFFLYLSASELPYIHIQYPKSYNVLHGSTRDKEPLVDARIDRGRSEVFIRRNGGELARVDAVGRLGNGQVGTADIC